MDQIVLDRPILERSILEPPGGFSRDNRVRTPQLPVPRRDSIRPSTKTVIADLPRVSAGELWLAVAASGAGSFDGKALTGANVIIYDRELTGLVAAVLPMGGYAEPAIGDGVERCTAFVQDGWSVSRLLAGGSSQGIFVPIVRAVAARLRAAGAPADLAVLGFAETGDGRFGRVEAPLGEIDLLLAEIGSDQLRAIAFAAFQSGLAEARGASIANGLAG